MEMKQRKLLFLLVLLVMVPYAFAGKSMHPVTASVYQSSSSTLGAGTALCTSVDIATANTSCSTAFDRSYTYRWEVIFDNTGTTNADIDRFDFRNVYGSGQGVGSATIVECGCYEDGAKYAGSVSTSSDDILCTFSSPSWCTLHASGDTETFYFIITIGGDSASDTNPDFKATSGGNTKASMNLGMTIATCGNNSKEGLVEVCDGTDVGGETCVSQGFDSGSLACQAGCAAFDTSSCIGCSSTCDGSCPGASCYGIDPDCDVEGDATLACCGNRNCEGENGESCSSCPSDCGVCDGGILPQVCGDGICVSPENRCGCPADCGACMGDVSGRACKEYRCISGACQAVVKLNCCGNELCEENENFSTCRGDCPTPKDFSIAPLWKPYYLRGESVNLVIDVNADFSKAVGAEIKASGFFGELVLYDDGLHYDKSEDDAIFGNSFTIGSDVNEGLIPITFDISMLDTKETKIVDLNVFPRLELDFESDERYVIGDITRLDGSVARRGIPIEAEINTKIYKGEELIFDGNTASNDKGVFKASYHSTTIDPIGKWVVSVKATDEFNNYEIIEKEIEILEVLMRNFLWIELTPPIVGSFKRGTELKLTVDVTDANKSALSDATVELIAPNGDREQLGEIKPGTYSGSYTIPWGLEVGQQKFEISANKRLVNLTQAGTINFTVPIEETVFITELVEPKEASFMVGDEVVFEVKMTYASGEPVKESSIEATINGQEIEMQPVREGVYSTIYYIANPAMEKIEFSVSALDTYQNFSEKSIELAVSGTSINYYIKSFPVAFYLLVFAGVLLVLLVLLSRMEAHTISSLRKTEAELLAEKREAETRYFKLGTIDKKTFNKLKSEIVPELASVRGEIAKMEEKILKRKQALERKKK